MEQEKIEQLLKSIGLNKNGVKVYVDLVKSGPSSALNISKRTKIHRSNTYDVLHGLIEKRFVKEENYNKKRLFNSMEPEKIKDYLKQKEKEIDLVILQLKTLSSDNHSEAEISITKEAFAAREMLLDLLKIEQPINIYGAPSNAPEIFGNGFIEDFHRKRIRKKITMKHIYNQNAKERIKELNRMPFTEAKHLGKKYDTHVSTNICGDVVVLIIFSNPVSVIKIKNKEIAETYKNYFELLWNKAKK